MMGLQNRVALVTGAGRGIGRAIAIALASNGVRIAAVDVNAELLRSTQEEIQDRGSQAFTFVADVSQRPQIETTVKDCMSAMGHLDILVNNAGINFLTPQWETIPEDEWDRVFAVNVKGPYFCTCAVSEPMKRQGWGRIINLGSVAGKIGGYISGIHYSASKAALMCLTKSFAQFLGPFGITVNAVAPGLIDTDMTAGWPEQSRSSAINRTLLGRIGRPEDIAGAVVYLASELAAYVTGEVLDVNGGFLMD